MTTEEYNSSTGIRWRNRLWFAAVLILYLMFACYQLGLPGLHYDEAREAGVNAMEILTGAPVSLFRNTGLTIFGRQWPVMVQDYIGATNVYLALPMLWLTGIGVPNLRIVAILLGAIALLLIERTVTEWQYYRTNGSITPQRGQQSTLPLSCAGLLAMTVVAASPSFIFWSRQGIFVTNLTIPLVFAMLWCGIRWLQWGKSRHLILAAFWGGFALYAKLLAIWVVGPFGVMLGSWWLRARLQRKQVPPITLPTLVGTVGALMTPLLPLLWFNFASGGTVRAVSANLGTSYYGVNNLAIWHNLTVRFPQFWHMMVGDHFWYLGGLYGNPLAGWLTILALLSAIDILLRQSEMRRFLAMPLVLLLSAFGASLFTLSDLFITHYVLLQPLAVSIVVLIFIPCYSAALPMVRRLLSILLCIWVVLDITASVRYHGALARSGGLADHSDAGYHLAYYLQYNGLGAPLALDWGFDAPIRYLSGGTVTPIELFGYDSLDEPDPQFQDRLQPFLDNTQNVYLLHAPTATIFHGRREQFLALVAEEGRQAVQENHFTQRDGASLYEVWRVVETLDSSE